MCFLSLLGKFSLFVLFILPQALGDASARDTFPWPWGQTCPLYPDHIQGKWAAMSPGGRGTKVYAYFEIHGQKVEENQNVDLWHMRIRRLGADSEKLVAHGVGFWSSNEMHLDVPLWGRGRQTCNYTASLHSYSRHSQQKCTDPMAFTKEHQQPVMLLFLDPMDEDSCMPKRFYLKRK